jgi:LacI family gluconate utilization system Gnt-I transcriptional repressor
VERAVPQDVNRTPTLADVAAQASVSQATVSRYLNNPHVVAKGTAGRIDSAIAATGYIPNAMAGGLATSKSRMVAVLIPRLVNSIFNFTIETMIDELAASGLNVMLGLTGVTIQRTSELIRAALGRRVDAIISTAPLTGETEDMLRRSRCLFIQIWELPEKPVGMAIGFSHWETGRDVARFLHDRGYRLPHLATADGARAMKRRDGFVAEWAVLGGDRPSESLVAIPSHYGHARKVFAEMRGLKRQPDVVWCGSDQLAQGLIVEAQRAGLAVPGDLGVMGFGNSPIAGEMRPAISSVDIDGARIAREAMAAIKRYSQTGEVEPKIIDVGFRLLARDSA